MLELPLLHFSNYLNGEIGKVAARFGRLRLGLADRASEENILILWI